MAMAPNHPGEDRLPLILDPPVGPHSDPRAIHDWLDELETLRHSRSGDEAALRAIDAEIARTIGWLQSRDDLKGAR